MIANPYLFSRKGVRINDGEKITSRSHGKLADELRQRSGEKTLTGSRGEGFWKKGVTKGGGSNRGVPHLTGT